MKPIRIGFYGSRNISSSSSDSARFFHACFTYIDQIVAFRWFLCWIFIPIVGVKSEIFSFSLILTTNFENIIINKFLLRSIRVFAHFYICNLFQYIVICYVTLKLNQNTSIICVFSLVSYYNDCLCAHHKRTHRLWFVMRMMWPA